MATVAGSSSRRPILRLLSVVAFITLSALCPPATALPFNVVEASISDVQQAFQQGQLTSLQLVLLYRARVALYESQLNAIIEINPAVYAQAIKADLQRAAAGGHIGGLHGIPILIKDNIGTKDRLNTTAGSFALLGGTVPQDAFLIKLLRQAGALIFGKANLSEFMGTRSQLEPPGFSPRGNQTKNPYNVGVSPGGSSSGSAVATAANLVLVSIGTETQGSLVLPASRNAVASLKPTPGLVSRSGLIPISFDFDTAGPIGKYVADVVTVLDVIAAPDSADSLVSACSKPSGGYRAHLLANGLAGKRIGIARDFYALVPAFKQAAIDNIVTILGQQGAVVVDNANTDPVVLAQIVSGVPPFTPPATPDRFVLLSDFKVNIKNYLATLQNSPVHNLSEIIAFDQADPRQQIGLYPDDIFIAANTLTSGQSSPAYLLAKQIVSQQNQNGFVKVFQDNNLDALLVPSDTNFYVLASLGGFPIFTIPAGYNNDTGLPFGASFVGNPCTEAKLVEIAFALESILDVRKNPPAFP